ncbi:hypothetical protein [Chondromyces crocatus]|uniref:Carboxypeptidase regulatory-like domain-containing protein n=1 Tax=Chondromyces crocatus TaxID=52 RepID=A0A0K1E7I4_CHOCO|nr:hypothetical protein [Chondromyces crocatus]AKT36533.1 uncharacterized protein CMC5_006490 [Chondromyces crocatus]
MRRLVLLALALSPLACKALDPPPPPPQVIAIRVESDPGRPLTGADLIYNGQKVAQTDTNGVGKLRLGGRDGELFDIIVACPEGYTSPERPTQVMLRRLADPTKNPEYFASCPPTTRSVVVAVRADGAPNTPITFLGREVARTDESGAAHVLLKLQPGEQFDLTIDTKQQGTELMPQSPARTFAVGQRNDVFTFDQKFERVVAPKAVRYAPSKPVGPVKIN